jgi:hypothetical protein
LLVHGAFALPHVTVAHLPVESQVSPVQQFALLVQLWPAFEQLGGG